jgi:Zn-dependent protease
MALPPPPPHDPRFRLPPPPPSDPRFEVLPPAPGLGAFPQQRPANAGAKKSGIMGGIVAIFIALAKFKFLLLGSLKTSLSMLFMIWIYSTMFGWPFAAGFVFLIFVHDMGHVVAAMKLGIPVSAPLFIPFLGAAITMKENPRDAWTEALMAYGGPLAGIIGGWICLIAAEYFGLRWVMAVASLTFVINLFNMIPLPPLDGGRICAAVSPWFWILGAILLGAALVFFHGGASIFILIFIFIVAIPRLKATLFQPQTDVMRAYYATSLSRRFLMAFLYLALAAVALLGYWDASEHLAYVYGEGT